MKALTLTQPWATLVAMGAKRIETRSWSTRYRGPIAIHAAMGFPREARLFAEAEVALGRLPKRLPFGAIIATGDLVDILPTEEAILAISALERLYGDYTPGRFAWYLPDMLAIELVPCKGMLGLWEWGGHD